MRKGTLMTNQDFTIIFLTALYTTARDLATKVLKNTDRRSDVISAQELMELQTELVLGAMVIVNLPDGGTDEVWEMVRDHMEFIEAVTY
jgi:hypothetical protein